MQRNLDPSSGTTARHRSPFTPTPCTNSSAGPSPRSRYSMVPAGIRVVLRVPSASVVDTARLR